MCQFILFLPLCHASKTDLELLKEGRRKEEAWASIWTDKDVSLSILYLRTGAHLCMFTHNSVCNGTSSYGVLVHVLVHT